MQLQTTLKLGGIEFTITDTVDSQAQFIEKAAFISSIPTVGPNGENDLRFVYRQTKEGHDYYSIISDLAGKEFKFGQSLKTPGNLFSKGWEDKYVVPEPVVQTAGFGRAQQPVAQQPVAQQPVAQQPVTQQLVAQQPVTQQPVNQAVMQQPVIQQPVVQQPVVAPAAANQAVANSVLSQFGIK